MKLPAASAVAQGDGAAYVTDDLRNLLLRFDPSNGKVEGKLQLAGRPAAMVLDGGDLWIAQMVDNEVVEVDASTLHVVRSVPVGQGPSGLAVLGRSVWVTSVIANEVTPIDASSGVAGTPVALAGGSVRVAAGFGALWVTGTGDTLTKVVPATGGVGAPAQTAVTVGQGPIGVTAGAGSVWVANAEGNTVSQVDPTSLRVTTLKGVGDDPLSIGVAGGQVYVGSGTAQTVRSVYPSPGSKPLDLDSTPRQLLRPDRACGWPGPTRVGCSRSRASCLGAWPGPAGHETAGLRRHVHGTALLFEARPDHLWQAFLLLRGGHVAGGRRQDEGDDVVGVGDHHGGRMVLPRHVVEHAAEDGLPGRASEAVVRVVEA